MSAVPSLSSQPGGDATGIEAIFDLLESSEGELKEHVQLIRHFDWTKSIVGNYDVWPREASTLVYLTMVATQPQCLLVGPEKILIYNPAFAHLIRDYHPALFGRPLLACYELSSYMDIIAKTLEPGTNGCSNCEKDVHLAFPNGGHLEEIVVSATSIKLPPPLRGSYVMLEDNTEAFVHDSREATLEAMSKSWSQATSLPSLWEVVLQSLEDRPLDFPFAALYTAKPSPDQDSISEERVNFDFGLFGCVGDFDNPLPGSLNKVSSNEQYIERMLQATTLRSPILLRADDGTLPESWAHASTSRGHCEPCRAAVVFPCSFNQYQQAKAILIFGLATRKPFNGAYQSWINEFHRKFGDAVGGVVAAQEAARRRQEAAQRQVEAVQQKEIENDLYKKELALRSNEAHSAMHRVKRLLDVMEEIDVGFFEYAMTGELLSANNAFYELSGYPRDPALNTPLAFQARLYPEDHDLAMRHWAYCMQGHSTTFEMRWKSDSPEGWTWVVAGCVPILDENGVMTSLWGLTTNITAQKRVEQEAIKKAEALEKARAVEARFFRFAEIAPVGILVADPTSLVSYCNKNWLDMTGHPDVPMDQIDFSSVVHDDDLPVLMENWKEVSVNGHPRSWQVRLKRLWSSSEGEPRGHVWAMITTLPEFNDDGTVKQVIGALMDVSHLKFAESEQHTRMEEALEAKRQQENFVDSISHEIRNPLGAVIQSADSICDSLAEMRRLISMSPSPATVGAQEIAKFQKKRRELFMTHIESSIDSADTIKSCSAHQKRIVDDILTMSKMDSNLLQLAPVPIDAAGLLCTVWKMFGPEAENSGIEVETRLDASIENLRIDWIVLDPGRVLQVLINLITNAIKFTKGSEGTRKVTVCMGCSKDRPVELAVDFALPHTIRDSIYDSEEFTEDPYHLWFTVQDTGCGMTTEEQSKIFSRFVQASRKTYNQYGGSGLGLFISRELVELQGGEIGVASQPGQGSTFAFFVKTHRAAGPALDSPMALPILIHGARRSSASTTPSRRTSIQPTEISVLVVEDNEVNQRVMKKQLLKYGYQVYVADHGQEALDFIKTTRRWRGPASISATTACASVATAAVGAPPPLKNLDVILMDVEMPVMDGITCSRRIRELQRQGHITSHIPIIAVSANARAEQINMTIQAGMDEAISKPFRIPDLTPRIDRLANWARMKRMEE